MNDAKFIELLNLFLDHEISAADAKLLEAEVQRNPQRRRLYREYCEMQKACVVLAEQAASATTAPEFKSVEVDSRERSWGLGSWGFGTYAAGFCAAAACLALAVVIRNGNGSATAAPRPVDAATLASVRIESSAGKPPISRDVPRTISVTPRTTELHPVFVAQSLALTKQQRDTVVPAVSTDPRFDWMNRVQVASLQPASAEELIFDAKSSLQSDANTFRSRRPIETQLKAAWQFQR